MKRSWFYGFLIVLCIASFAFIYGCGSNATGGGGGGGGGGVTIVTNRPGTYEYSGPQSQGDVWTWVISTETFFGTNETKGFWVSGTYETLSTKFCKAFVIDSSDPTITGETAVFLEFPNTMLMVHPVSTNEGNGDNIIICAAHSADEPPTGKYIWVTMPWQNWDPGMTAYGTVEVTQPGGEGYDFSFYVTPYLMTDEAGAEFEPSPNTYTYDDGVLTGGNYPSGDPMIFMTPTGVFMGDQGPGNGGIAGCSYEAIVISNLINKEYRGVMFNYFASTGTNETWPIAARPISTTTMRGTSYIDNDITKGEDPTKGVTITFEAQAATGILTMYTHDIGNDQNGVYKAVAAKVGSTGKYMLCAFGIEQGNPRNFLVIQVDD